MADTIKKFLSLERLQEYDALIKQEIADSANGKADASHSHNDLYYTESEVDTKISAVNTSISNITNGSVAVKEAEHAESADEATHATSADSATTAQTATSATTATKATQDGSGNVITSTYETKTDASAKLAEAKSYADSAATQVKNDLLNGAGAAYDTLKELGDLISTNVDAIDALETVAAGKADKSHSHAIADVTGLQSALDGKAASSHTHTVSQISDLTVTAAELNVLDGITATTTELNYVDGVTSNIQTQLDSKAASSHSHTITATATDDDVIVLTGTNGSNKVTFDAKHATSGVTAGTYKSVTVNAYGHVTGGTNPTTLSGYGITDAYTKTQVDSAVNAAKVTVDTALSTTSTNPVQNKVVNSAINTLTSTVSANTSSISSHTTAIQNLQTAVGEITEITSAEIQSLFS